MVTAKGGNMGFRFRKSIKILPGVRINLSKSGVSTSIGRPGATVNIREGKTTTTVGIPGIGLSYRSSSPREQESPTGSGLGSAAFWILLVFVIVIIWASF
jgi:L,D-peptidoglycan transpeptidase YkuD (ErfK/YbiS/YcfS/YnhG family)